MEIKKGFAEERYNTGEIKKIYNESDGSNRYLGFVDGKLHGANVLYNQDNEVVSVKVYNHGKSMDVSDKRVDFITEEKNGLEHNYLLVDGNKFGWESIIDKEGNAKIAFFNENEMVDCLFNEVKYSVDVFSKESLRDEIKNQSGEKQKLGGQYVISNAKCMVALNRKSLDKDKEDNISDKNDLFEKRIDEKSQSMFVMQTKDNEI